MSSASEEYIHQQDIIGSITALPSPMSEPQYHYILDLLDKSILSEVQKQNIYELINSGNLTRDHASRIIESLHDHQKNPLDRVRDGEMLPMTELKKAIRKTCDDPNT